MTNCMKLNMIQQCPGSQEGQPCPGGHQAQDHQQGRGLSCSTLHWCCLILSPGAVLAPQYKNDIELLESIQKMPRGW